MGMMLRRGRKGVEAPAEVKVEEKAEMTRSEMLDMASEMGIKVPARATKAEIAELIGV